MKLGYLGPPGTFSHEALASSGVEGEPVPLPTIYDTVIAVHDGRVDRALVPIENSLEGSVNATVDALALETDDVVIVGEVVHPVRHSLVARGPMELDAITTVVSHPQASGQCARFIRERLPAATVIPAASTAEAVRLVTERGQGDAALGTRLAATLYGGEVLLDGVEDIEENETRFVWLAPAGSEVLGSGPWKTELVFWGAGAEAPGWLVRCLSEFAFRGVNLTRIESRPRKQGLGSYMFFVDVEGRESDDAVTEALQALRMQTGHVRVLGSHPGAG